MFEQNLMKECSNPLCQRQHQLIIMDIGMPIKDGFVASKEILNIQNNLNKLMREENDNQDIIIKETINFHNSEIIALTSFTDQNTKDICKNIGIKEVLNKPIHHQELLRIILMYSLKLNFNQYKYYLQLEPQKQQA